MMNVRTIWQASAGGSCVPVLTPHSGLSSPPPACLQPAELGVWVRMALGPEPRWCRGEGVRKRLRGRGTLKVQSLTSNFLMFSGGQGLWEAANHPGSCGSTFLSSRQLKIPAFPYFWPHPVPIEPLDQDQGTSLLPPPPPPYVPLGPVDMGWWPPLWSWLGSGREPRSQS